MAVWRVACRAGNREVVQALATRRSYPNDGTCQPIQIASTVTLSGAGEFPREVGAIYQRRRDALCDGLDRMGWEMRRPQGTMFAWAPIPDPYREMGSIEFAPMLVREANVATSPGVGFGPDGDGYVTFEQNENEQGISKGRRSTEKGMHKP